MPTLMWVAGIPAEATLSRLIKVFKKLLGMDTAFWIKSVEGMKGSDTLNLAVVEIDDPTEARRAQKLLDRFEFSFNNMVYPLQIRRMREDESPKGNDRRDQHDRYARKRSRSPHHAERFSHHSRSPYGASSQKYARMRSPSPRYGRAERFGRRSPSPQFRPASRVEMELELLRKQRLIIEEERKLLLERKKLELVQEFGPRALREFELERPSPPRRETRTYRSRERSPGRHARRSTGRSLRRSRERSPVRRPPPPPPRIGKNQWESGTHDRQKRTYKPEKPSASDTQKMLPSFYHVVKALTTEMAEHINSCESNNPKQIKLLNQMISIKLRKRLAVLCHKKPIMSSSKIVKLYREAYPASADEPMVKRIWKDLNDHVITDEKSKADVKTKGVKQAHGEKSEEIENKDGGDAKEVTEEKKATKVEDGYQVKTEDDAKDTDDFAKDLKDSEEIVLDETKSTDSDKEENGKNEVNSQDGTQDSGDPADLVVVDEIENLEDDEANLDDWVQGTGEDWQ